MPETDFRQPDLGPLRAPAEAAEFAQTVSGMVTAYGCRLAAETRAAARSVPGQGEPDHADQVDRAGGPVQDAPNGANRVDRGCSLGPMNVGAPVRDVDVAAVAAYRASLREGRPLSERKLAEAFGRTSRRWAGNRMAEARQSPVSA